MSEDVPPLDDFEDELKSINYNSNKNYGSEDYTKPDLRHLDDQEQKEEMAKIQDKVQGLATAMQNNKPKQDYAGFRKGFLSGPNTKTITEVKPTNKNPLQFKEVQQAMNMNNYLQETKSQWMTDNFVDTVTQNEKMKKLFTNPEYIKAIEMFKNNPKEAMAKYGHDQEFMAMFQEFCKMMGKQFQSLANKAKG